MGLGTRIAETLFSPVSRDYCRRRIPDFNKISGLLFNKIEFDSRVFIMYTVDEIFRRSKVFSTKVKAFCIFFTLSSPMCPSSFCISDTEFDYRKSILQFSYYAPCAIMCIRSSKGGECSLCGLLSSLFFTLLYS